MTFEGPIGGDALLRYLHKLAETAAADAGNRGLLRRFRDAARAAGAPLWQPRDLPGGPDARSRALARARVDVIVPVHDALEETAACLTALRATRTDRLGTIWLVDDCSGDETAAWLRAQADDGVQTLRTPANLGFTGAVALGLQHAQADLVVVLNSDAVVGPGWLEGMARPFATRARVAMTGPLSNAAAWQSLGRVTRAGGDYATNALPSDAEAVTAFLAAEVGTQFVELPIVHGFCFMLARDACGAVGGLDLDGFGRGYGETQDLSLRINAAGYRTGVVTDVFVRHARSRSYSDEDRAALSLRARETLYRKHGAFAYLRAESACIEHPDLARIRAAAAGWFADSTVDVPLFAADTPRPGEFAAIATGLHLRRQGRRGGRSLVGLPRHGGIETAVLPWEEPGDESAGDARRLIAAHAAAVSPGPEHEELAPAPPTAGPPRAKVLAYYLPQFHAITENDRFWGKGFTEWRNLPRGLPRFEGHVQPRIPRDLGHYDLAQGDVMRRQIAMARAAGLHGFCHYYYRFDGKRVLEAPLERMLADPTVDFPFCLMWANENWTRTWDGAETEVLLRQTYREEDDIGLVDDLARHFADPRYIRIGGRPLFFIYRPGSIPDSPARIARWRALFEERHALDPLIFMAQAIGDNDPRRHHLDGAIEFPPHKVLSAAPEMDPPPARLDPGFSGRIWSYDSVIAAAEGDPVPDYPLIRTVFPSWDNDARRPGRGSIIHGSTPVKFARWLDWAVTQAEENPVFGESFVCINAWNEWAEGAYLEPDVHFGAAYLNAVSRVVRRGGLTTAAPPLRVLLVGHDAFAHGAQMLLANIGAVLRRVFGCEVTFLLRSETPRSEAVDTLMARYRAVGAVHVACPADDGLRPLLRSLVRQGYRCALTNTTVTGDLVPALKAAGFRVVSLIHELPHLLKSYDLGHPGAQIADSADAVVFPAEVVRAGFVAVAGPVAGEVSLRPQGLYRQDLTAVAPGEDDALRAELGLAPGTRIVLGIGYADLRKGIDRFVTTAMSLCADRADTAFLWLGAASPEAGHWFQPEIDTSGLGSRIRILGHREDVARFLATASVFYLTSREDAFPSVVMEALAVGLPVVGFAGTGGCDDLIDRHGTLVRPGDVVAAGQEIEALLDRPPTDAARDARRAEIASDHRFDDYCLTLLRTLAPEVADISVVVPNYNYAGVIGQRLHGILAQSHPVREVIVLDDASTDASIPAIRAAAEAAGRDIRLICNATNSGSPFAQWRKGVALARGEFVWIAEADDDADPAFLQRMAARMQAAGSAIGFADSWQMNEAGRRTGDSYRPYLNDLSPGAFDRPFDMAGPEFLARFLAVKNVILNVSGVLFRRAALVAAMERLGTALDTHAVAGDWRLYIDICAAGGGVAYEPSALNGHRRHVASVTRRTAADRHLSEIAMMHRHAARLVTLSPAVVAMQERHLMACRRHLSEGAER